MPTYDYECKKCGRFELFQRITEEKIKKCPTCKGPVKRLLGAGSGIIFKGTGFYQTDYRSDGYKRSSTSESGGEAAKAKSPSDTGSASAKSESKSGPADATSKPAKAG